jgi:hypothetical protein
MRSTQLGERRVHEEESDVAIDDGVEVGGVVAGDAGVVAEFGLLLGHEVDGPDPHEQVEDVEDVVEELAVRSCERRRREGRAYRQELADGLAFILAHQRYQQVEHPQQVAEEHAFKPDLAVVVAAHEDALKKGGSGEQIERYDELGGVHCSEFLSIFKVCWLEKSVPHSSSFVFITRF